jgi:transcriptional regulator with XRE-family HTH domain
MNIKLLLDRVTQRREQLGLSEAEIAQAGGSIDLIRNWRRAERDGKPLSPRLQSLQSIADRLGVTVAWLTGEDDAATPDSAGFSETARAFDFSTIIDAETSDPLAAILGHHGKHLTTMLCTADMPAFALLRDDVVVADMSRTPVQGELAVINGTNEHSSARSMRVMRYLPPYLMDGGQKLLEMPMPDNELPVLFAVVGIIRGCKAPT